MLILFCDPFMDYYCAVKADESHYCFLPEVGEQEISDNGL